MFKTYRYILMYFDIFPKTNIKTKSCNESTGFVNCGDATLPKARPIRLDPTPEQRTILLKWFEAYRKTYNLAVNYQRKLEFNKLKNILSFETLRNTLRHEDAALIDRWMNESLIPKHVLNYAFTDVAAAYKASISNIKNMKRGRKAWKLEVKRKQKLRQKRDSNFKVVKKVRKNKIRKNQRYNNTPNRFRIRYKKRSCPRQTIHIPFDTFSKVNNTFAPKVLGNHIKSSSKLTEIEHGVD